MDKSGDCDSDGSISWEDFFGSSSDLVPTLLTMYDALIAQTLSDENHKNQNPKLVGTTQLQKKQSTEKLRWDSSSSASTMETSSAETNRNLLSIVENSNSSAAMTETQEPKAQISDESFKSSVANGNNIPIKTLILPLKNGANPVVTPQQQHKLGVISRSFSKWSSRITDKSSNSKVSPENGKLKGSPKKGSTVQHSTVTPPSQSQRPLSVNSTFSSTSTSSCSSESSASMNNGGKRAPKASPEDEDDIPDGELSDDDDSSRRSFSCAKGSTNQNKTEIDRCFTTSTSKDYGGGGDAGKTFISCPISAQGKPKFYDANLSYMDRVVMEIVETERVYVTDLREIISGYLDHWRFGGGEEKPLELDDVTELFSNIEEIHEFNSEFVTQLEGCGLDPVKVAKCFVTKNEGFSIYTQYCTHYPRTMFILTEMMRQEQSAKYFRERQASLGHSLPLGSYLLKPVQRILKYHLLLQNIVKHYDRGEEGYEAIVEALSAMTNIAHHINDMKRRHEHAVRVQEIQSLLYGWQGEDLTTYGELCAEGTFRVYGAKALRHVFLFDKMLLITKKKEDGILSYKSHIMCSNLMLIESVPGELLSFHVIPFDNPRLQCTLQAKNSEQKREWTLQLKRVILENYHAVIPTHARQLVMELGQCRPQDGNFLPEKVQTKRQHSAPEYLARRKQEKDRRKAESTIKAKLRKARKSDPISPNEGAAVSRRNRRTSVDSNISTPDRSESREDSEDIIGNNGIDRKMSSASCPAGIPEKRLVKKLSGWRRKSEPGFYLNGIKGKVSNGLMSPAQGNSHLTISTTGSIDEEIGGGEEEDEDSSRLEDSQHLQQETIPNIEQRRESVEEIVGQLVMQNREFQRILSKQRLVHLRRALAQHQQRKKHVEYESGSEAETEDSISTSTPIKNSPEIEKNLRVPSPSNGIGSASDINEDSSENIASESVDPDLSLLASKNVQRTVSDPGNKTTLTPRRFINSPFSHYDPISLLWSSFRKTDPTRRNLTNNKESENNELKSSNGKPNIRHTHSFTCSRKEQNQKSPTETKASETSLPHGDSGVFPNSFTSDSSSSSEANIPTLPAVWLKQQGEHLVTPNTKSGSLPRSFQVGQHQPSPLPTKSLEMRPESPGVKSRFRHSSKYPVPERPFTIASDKPSPSDMSYDEMEQYMSKFNDQMSRSAMIAAREDIDSLTATEDLTPITSMENLSLHPDHKIYRSSKSSIKHILLSVTHRLSGIKANRITTGTTSVQANAENKNPVSFGSYPNISTPTNGSLDIADKMKNGSSGFLSRQHHKKSLKQKLKDQIVKEDSDSENGESVSSSGFGSIGSCGSSTNLHSKKVGARLAQCCEASDYALSKLLGSSFIDIQRPQSVMSGTSTVTSSSSTDDKASEEFNGLCPGVFLRRNSAGKGISHRDLYLSYIDQDGGENENGGLSDSDGSADSFYERSFEAIENFLENEMFPDSAIYSDQDDLNSSSGTSKSTSPGSRAFWRSLDESAEDSKENPIDRRSSLQLPIHDTDKLNTEPRRRSRLVCSQAILEKLQHLEQCAQFQRDGLPSPSFEGMKSIQQRRKELELWKNGLGTREDESETSSQHSTSTINTVIELSPSKSTSFPSSRRCSDTESSGGSPQTERAVSRSSGRSHSQGHLIGVGASPITTVTTASTGSIDPMPRGWVKLLVEKLEGEES